MITSQVPRLSGRQLSGDEFALSARILSLEEIAIFPVTYKEQAYLAGVLACRQEIRREQQAGHVGKAALNLAIITDELARATRGF